MNMKILIVEDEVISALALKLELQNHGYDSELFYEISDFKKKAAIVPCSAKTGEGIPELLFVLAGLSQRFLTKKILVELRGLFFCCFI